MYPQYNISINVTNSTSDIIYTKSHDSYWQTIICYLLFIYVLSCTVTINLKMCHAETYRENIVCCCCMFYRDIVNSALTFILYIILGVMDCIQCNCISNKKSNQIKKCLRNKHQQCKFIIKNTITPLQATMVDDSNINTSIVIEGLNNNQKTISILIVPIDELIC